MEVTEINNDIIVRHITIKRRNYNVNNEIQISQLTEELRYYLYKHVVIEIKNASFNGVLVRVGQSFINIISEGSLVIIPLNNLLVITCVKL